MVYRYFECEECHTRLFYPKKKKDKLGHEKKVFCGICGRKTKWRLIEQ